MNPAVKYCRFVRLLLFVLVSSHLTTQVIAEDTSGSLDPVSGLIVAEHWELARAHCGACHSYRLVTACLLYTSPSPRDATLSRMPSSA